MCLVSDIFRIVRLYYLNWSDIFGDYFVKVCVALSVDFGLFLLKEKLRILEWVKLLLILCLWLNFQVGIWCRFWKVTSALWVDKGLSRCRLFDRQICHIARFLMSSLIVKMHLNLRSFWICEQRITLSISHRFLEVYKPCKRRFLGRRFLILKKVSSCRIFVSCDIVSILNWRHDQNFRLWLFLLWHDILEQFQLRLADIFDEVSTWFLLPRDRLLSSIEHGLPFCVC